MSKTIEWQPDAIQRLKKAPFFIRGIAKRKVETAARKAGLQVITLEFMETIKKKEMG